MYFLLKKAQILVYNKNNEKPNPGMFDPPFLFEPTLTFWESKNRRLDVRPHVVVGRRHC